MPTYSIPSSPDHLQQLISQLPSPFNTLRDTTPGGNPASFATRSAEYSLQHAAATGASETSLNRKRVVFQLQQLQDDGIVTSVSYRSRRGSRNWLIEARGFRGERAYTLGEMEAFIHGCDAARSL